ncbi:hypothetical protein INT47_007411 [Mucor saturninus]|uniref:Tc1-like transposase DDE domain-containing protein n=1 Tax=Mucor saturninus TaxID=64648 RepID=A0A8H7V4X3_9FUNG|nr:hypothetical protein INT47_007411 [Mucor saturninus]
MSIDNLMSDMSLEEEVDLTSEVSYVNLYQLNSTLKKDDMVMAMECDDELAEELGLVADDILTDEEDDEELVTKTSIETEVQVNNFCETHLNQPELKLNSKGEKPYRKYTDEQIDHFIDLIASGESVKSACESTGIALWSGYKYKKTYNNDPEHGLIRRKKRGAKESLFKLKQHHAEWIISYIDDKPTAVLDQISESLCRTFETENLSISRSALHRFIRAYCALSMKRLEKIPARRNHIDVIEQRKLAVETWLGDEGMDFQKNCVSIDEAGFNVNITRNRGWSKRGTPAKAIVPSARSTSITILGAISVDGVIDISLRKPTSSVATKKRKVDGREVKINGRVGTRSEHFLTYLSSMMDCLDRNGLHGYYLVMDNAPIHKPAAIRELIENRGYKCVYLPPYSPFLNPIEEFWSKVKAGIKRNPLDSSDLLTPRIMESVTNVTLNDCRGWIKHSVSFFPRCIAKEKML